MLKHTLVSLALTVGGTCDAASIDLAIACVNGTPPDQWSSIEVVSGLEPGRTDYCADSQLFWRGIQVRRVELYRHKEDGSIHMLIEVSDDSKPVLSHISSEYMHHQLLVISNGNVVGAPIIEGVFQSKFELVVPDQEIGKAIVRSLRAT